MVDRCRFGVVDRCYRFGMVDRCYWFGSIGRCRFVRCRGRMMYRYMVYRYMVRCWVVNWVYWVDRCCWVLKMNISEVITVRLTMSRNFDK